MQLLPSEQDRLNKMGSAFGLPKGLHQDDYIREFVRRARKVHGEKYEYADSYFSFKTKTVAITCSLHGIFHQKPYLHLRGAGCKACADIARGKEKTQKAAIEFIHKSMNVHGNRYDYSNVHYEKSSKKVEIVCLNHGSFFQRPNSHLRGVGCPKCGTEDMADKQRKSLDHFLQEAHQVHGDKYDYSSVAYQNFHTHVKIICHEHGEFKQTPAGHLKGHGCVWCAARANSDNLRITSQEFIDRAISIHGAKYSYSKVTYQRNSTPVEIICPNHGSFFQQPAKHIDAKQGCPSCANRDMDVEKFISRSKLVHGNRYDYSQAEYKGARKNLTIVCSEHGPFRQVAQHHMSGSGCEKCIDTLNSRGSQAIETWLVANNIEHEREKRFDSLRSPKNKRYRLRWDFYLPNHKTLIEFDGEQHFAPREAWGGVTALRELQNNDELKNAWAIRNNFNLIRISFDQINDIAEILNNSIF